MTHDIDPLAARDRLGGAKLHGVSASDLRVVAMDFHSGSSTEHMVLAEQLDVFIDACKSLHFKPGINPHNGAETSRIWRLRVSELRASGPYWWAQTRLGTDADGEGAFTISAGISKTVWQDENYQPDEVEDD